MKQETPTITAMPRERIGSRYAKRLRKEGRLPAVIYGHKKDPAHISIDEKEVERHLREGWHVLNVDLDGRQRETCLVKDLQFGYLGDNLIHIDFARVDLDEEVVVNVHLHFVGQPKVIEEEPNAIVSQDLNELEIRCKVSDIPEEIRVDLSEVESSLNVGDIPLPPGIVTTMDPDHSVMHIDYVQEEEAEGEEIEVGAEVAEEPEVISEAKEQESEGEEEDNA